MRSSEFSPLLSSCQTAAGFIASSLFYYCHGGVCYVGEKEKKEYCSFRNRISWVDDKFTDSLKLIKIFEKIYLIDLLEIRCSFYFPINQRSLFTKHICQSSA